MPINKFTTLLDLARQAKILSGETATFDGKIQVGIPFSGYPSGIDTGSTVSLGVVSSESALFSGNTGTTIFDVSNPLSPNYNVLFSGYTATTWTNPLFSGNTSGLTLPITPLSADTQIVGPFWTLTQTGMTGDYVIGTQYTGYSITYSFFGFDDPPTTAYTSYSGITTASQENFSAGTLDYKGPLDYLSSKEDATVEGRLTTNKITITNGASSATTNYILAQTDDTGNGEWNSLSSLLSGACHPLINLEVISGCSVSGLTIESDVTVNGNVVINGSATTINTEIIQSKDNNIVLNYSGTHLTAIGGGITLEDGVSNGVDSRIYTDSDGTWLFYPGLSATSGTILNFTADTISVNSIGDSGDCVNELYVTNIYGCSPIIVHDNIQNVTSSALTGTYVNVFGKNNAVLGTYYSGPLFIGNSILGGRNNTIDSVFNSTIGGGVNNNIIRSALAASYSGNFIGAGANNNIYDNYGYNFIGAGRFNEIAPFSHEAFIGGGSGNYNYSSRGVIVGGSENRLESQSSSSFIGAGYNNTLFDNYSVLVGGRQNTLSGNYSIIGGGYNNYMSGGTTNGIFGGQSNTIHDSNGAAIFMGRGCGIYNSSLNSIIGGGFANIIDGGSRNFIGGGRENIIDEHSYGVITGGKNNTFSGGEYNFIGSGKNNEITGNSYSSIVVGYNNYIKSDYGFIGGGKDNKIKVGSIGSSIIGGTGNTINQINSHLIGSNLISVSANTTHVERLNIGTIGSNPPIGNLGFDSSGFVVTGTTSFTGNTSGDCINDIYVSNIHSCSPLNINSLDEGNVYFGSTSGVTIDVLNGRIGIGTEIPTEKLHIENGDILITNTYGKVSSELGLFTPNDVVLTISGDSSLLTGFRVQSPSVGGLDMGVRGISEVTFPNYGKVGDSFVISSVQNNGLNIGSAPGTGTDDYIRLSAGQFMPSGHTPDIHIQGSGATRGFVGFNNSDPLSQIDISGATAYQQLRLRQSYTPSSSGDTNGNVGDIAWDDNYIYIKTNTGWGRTSLDYGF